MTTIDLGPRYKPIRELGSGGMGRVFLVRDLHLEKDVALKVLQDPPLTSEDLEQVQKEFALLSQVEHPGIARAHDFGYAGGCPYFTSEFVEGQPLSAALPIEHAGDILRIARDVAEALAFLHENAILHLDIKPSNIIVPTPRGHGRAVLIDFGLFRRGLNGKAEERIKGSVPYMAPERFRGEKLGPWTDVYALGVTLYQTATGAFPRASFADVPTLEDLSAWDPSPRPPSELKPALPAEVDRIVLKCLALDPRSRFPSARELLAALCQVGGIAPSSSTQSDPVPLGIGRGAELREVDRFLDRLLRGADGSSALLITGQPGMGQTHLLREMKVRAQTMGIPFYLETGYVGRLSAPGSILRCLAAHMAGDEGARSRWERFLTHLRRPRRPTRSEATEGERRLRRAAEAALAASKVEEPLVLAVDGLQLLDEVSAGLWIDLIRGLTDRPREERPRLAIAAAYREEGPLASMLEELTRHLLQPGKAQVITLGPLGLEETIEMYRGRGGTESDAGSLTIFQRTGGVPAKIAALAAQEKTRVEKEQGSPQARAGSASFIDRESRRLLLVFQLLERPAGVAEFARCAGISRAQAKRFLERLRKEGLISEMEPGKDAWLPEAASRAISGQASPSERENIHLEIARSLLKGRAPERSRLVEAVRHFRAAGSQREVLKHGLPAAQWLKSNFQNRAALEMLRAILEALPANRGRKRLEVAVELAELHSRVGEVDEGIRVLRELLPRARRLPPASRSRALLALAALHSRRGDFRRADVLFQEGLRGFTSHSASKKRWAGGLSREEILFFLNERAALKAAMGEHTQALELCEEGLRLAGKRRSLRVQEVSLNLHATRANVALRTHDFESALRGFETSLEIAESIGSLASQATVLNNIGVLYLQCDRYQDALRSFLEAEKHCLDLDEGPSLASIYGNLAVLHARVGDFPAMDEALREGDRLKAGIIGRRQELFLLHARGLSNVIKGRFVEARVPLEKAIEMGDAMGDRHVAAFDRAYRGEALLFEGAYGEAGASLRGIAGAEWPGRVRKMALARLALLEAVLARGDESVEAAAKHSELSSERPIPYLDAWDDLFLGWSLSILGARDRAETRIELAEEFFRREGLTPALSLAVWVRAEAFFLRGECKSALEILRRGPVDDKGAPRRSDLTAVLWPLLEARILLKQGAGREDIQRAADLLAEAGAALLGNPLPEWEARLEALRGALVSGEGQAERIRMELARGLSEKDRERSSPRRPVSRRRGIEAKRAGHGHRGPSRVAHKGLTRASRCEIARHAAALVPARAPARGRSARLDHRGDRDRKGARGPRDS